MKSKSIVKGKWKPFVLRGVAQGDAGSYNHPIKKKKKKTKKNIKGGYFHAWGWKPSKKSKQQAEYRRKLAAQYNRSANDKVTVT